MIQLVSPVPSKFHTISQTNNMSKVANKDLFEKLVVEAETKARALLTSFAKGKINKFVCKCERYGLHTDETEIREKLMKELSQQKNESDIVLSNKLRYGVFNPKPDNKRY